MEIDNKATAVTAYLQHMLSSARSLMATTTSSSMDEDVVMEDASGDNPDQQPSLPDELLDTLTQTLLEVAAVLHHPVQNCLPPPPAPVQHDWDPIDHDLLERAYTFRRTDYLRRLLRALAPVALEIAARLLEIPVSPTNASQRECATLLYGFWLPIAPQVLQGFMDGVAQGRLPFLLRQDDHTNNDDTLLVRLEATYHIARECWYTHRHRQPIVDWGDWSVVALHQPHYPWFARRIIAYVTDNYDNHEFLSKIPGVATPIPYEYMLHPTDLHLEAMEYSRLLVEEQATRVLWKEAPIHSPAPADLYTVLQRPHQRLCHLHQGYVFWKYTSNARTKTNPSIFVPTPTSASNLHQLCRALCVEDCRPILLKGGGGASVVRHAAQSLHVPSVLELYLDETTDAATLLGTMTVAEDGGQQFRWQAGAITKAALAGHWLLLHHFDTVVDVQALLEPLLQDGILPGRRPQRVHRNFRCFAVVQQPMKVLHPHYFISLQMDPVPREELLPMAQAVVAPRVLPPTILEAVQQILLHTPDDDTAHTTITRPFLKLMQRLASVTTASTTEHAATQYCTEHDRLCCLADAVDCWVQRWSDPQARQVWIQTIAAPAFQLHPTTAVQFVLHRSTMERVPDWLSRMTTTDPASSFAYTPSTIRLLESLAVAVRHNEPVLLVGETGTGKTTVIQQLARLVPTNTTTPIELVVQNVSLQTDATDLLGGYRPLELQQVARTVYHMFVDVFTGTFSRQQNAAFLQFAATAYQQQQWKKLSGCFRKAAALGLQKVNNTSESAVVVAAWNTFRTTAERFERQRTTSGPLFAFTEGALVDAMRTGKWVLLDEINLASSETLQRLTGLLGNDSLTLTERGDAVALERHPSFRLFAAMNPATDTGKKELTRGMRNKFTELYVDELLDPAELRQVVARYGSSISTSSTDDDHTLQLVVDLYLKFRAMADESFVDGSGQRPRYTLRTLTRTVTAACQLVVEQKYPFHRALFESLQLAFQGSLDPKSYDVFAKVLSKKLGKHVDLAQCDKPCRRPGGRQGANDYHLVQPFWIRSGPNPSQDWADENESQSRFVLVPGTLLNLRRLARAVASGPWPVLLEGPTSAGKTTLVEYMAARCGHTVVRVNNHEHTDVQEYTGGYAADANGSLTFQDGILVSALRVGHWVILDELNLAPSDVLEALNRLLDDNRELYIAETNETVRPHPNFRLFATQNPSGSYGGRKPLSRAFRNRFVEIQVNDIKSEEMTTILVERCKCPPSHAQLLVDVMNSLRQHRSRSGVFLGSSGFITPRDLLRWAERGAVTKRDLAREGYMLLAERLRSEDEKGAVREEIERIFKLDIDMDDLYYSDQSLARTILHRIDERHDTGTLSRIAPTKSLLRVVTLVQHCMKNREPVLLVGETGCGKTMSVQLLSLVENAKLNILNCHQTTETSDIIGGLRPVRGRRNYRKHLLQMIGELKSRVELDCVQLGIEAISDNTLTTIVQLIRSSRKDILDERGNIPEPSPKCRRLSPQHATNSMFQKMTTASLLDEIQDYYTKYMALFEWEDGPLVRAMKQGENFLLDEMSLAEDAVLERLNSVLEPSRTLVLAEKPCTSKQSRAVVSQPAFQLFATMNPGGDFGKRELSPALRSRFTEIWVPPVKDMEDIGLVLKRSFSSLEGSVSVAKRMLEYVAWFNDTICADLSGMLSGLSLSLRDILSWSSFIDQCMQKSDTLSLWDAYIHGAQLMHLDGLGLGTGVALEHTCSVVEKARLFVRKQVEQERGVTIEVSSNEMHASDDRFGIGQFTIPMGHKAIAAESSFFFGAPTPSTNVRRILRALQLTKPVLLEGPPGCGKTSLVASLASVAGHDIVRINLSEQTDMTDLIGSDIPVHDPASSVTTFRWADGALLGAIKAGSWVLLDELNLASQSVLEGLNGCLDHRAEVFIPELGKTFSCPDSFRVFAAQNPLLQGGGRKGLPKSFLNRFTKVHLEALCDADFDQIVHSTFPQLVDIDKVVEFNRLIHKTSVEDLSFGQEGAPFEFNLRDIFRWGSFGASSSWRRASLLYIQRFRRRDDRERARKIYESVFGPIGLQEQHPTFSVSDWRTKINNVGVRRVGNAPSSKAQDTILMTSLLEPLESVAMCISKTWPVLLIGRRESNGPGIPRTLASVLGCRLIEMSLCPATDVSELIGSFEQIDPMAQFLQLADDLVAQIHAALKTSPNPQNEQSTIKAVETFRNSCCQGIGLPTGVRKSLALISTVMESCPESMNADFRALQYAFNALHGASEQQVSFAWKDGPLVEAMKLGHWLHLRNVNMCSSSVLDRLNPVMEPDGCLLLTESGMNQTHQHGESIDSACNEIRCHPDFRILLSMDANNGEVSRAMRNRCVEVFVFSDGKSEENPTVDHLDQCARQRLVPRYLGSLQANARSVRDKSAILAVQNTTSCQLAVSGSSARRGIYSEEGILCDVDKSSAEITFRSSLVPKQCIRDGWCAMSHLAEAVDETRLLPLLEPLLTGNEEHTSLLDWVPCSHSNVLRDLPQTKRLSKVHFRNHLVALVVDQLEQEDKRDFLLFAASRQNSQLASLKFINGCLQNVPTLQHQTKCARGEAAHALNRHIAWDLCRVAVTDRLLSPEPLEHVKGRLSFLEASFCLSEGSSIHSVPNGSVLPLLSYLYPVLGEFVDLGKNLSRWITVEGKNDLVKAIVQFHGVIVDMWLVLDGWNIADGEKSGAIRSALIIQWRCCQSSFQNLVNQIQSHSIETPEMRLRQVAEMIAASEQAISGFNDEKRLITSLQEYLPLPLVPQSPEGWTISIELRRIALSLCVDRRQYSRKRCWSLATAMNDHDVGTFSTLEVRNDILCALSTLQLSGPKIQSTVNMEPDLPKKIDQALRQHQDHVLSLMALFKPNEALEEPTEGVEAVSSTGEISCGTNDVCLDFNALRSLLLTHLANLQISAAAEWWSEQKEAQVISLLSEFLLSGKSLDSVKASVTDLVNVGLSHSQWSVADLCPFKTILWILEQNEDKAQKEALRRIVPLLRCGVAKRNWLRCSDLFISFSMRLEIPFFGDLSPRVPENTREPTFSLIERTAFSLVGRGQFDSHFSSQRGLSATTLENYGARQSQMKSFFKLMSMGNLPKERRLEVEEMEFAFMELVFAAQNQTLPKNFATWPENEPWYNKEANITALFRELISPDVFQVLVLPLIELMKTLRLHELPLEKSNAVLAQASVYLGLMQFHFSLPSSLEDPGELPLGSLLLKERKLGYLASEFAAHEVYNFWKSGVCMQRTNRGNTLLDECSEIRRNQEVDRVNIIERPSECSLFESLFQATTSFASSHASVESVLLLLQKLTASSTERETMGGNEAKNWKRTAESFCDRLLEEFAAYEDVVAPIVGAVGRICNGISRCVSMKQTRDERHCSTERRSLMNFPQNVDSTFRVFPKLANLSTETTQSVGMAVLQDLLQRKRLVGLDIQSLAMWRRVVFSLLNLGATELSLKTMTSSPPPDLEQDLKTQFPNFHRDFLNEDQSVGDAPESSAADDEGKVIHSIASTVPVDQLSNLHSSVFLDDENYIPTEADRLLQFETKYIAARSLHFSDDIDFDDECVFSPGHAMALAMAASKESLVKDELRSPVEIFDIYRDASPQRAHGASLPLARLYARTLQLLSIFPSNTILLDVARVVDKVMKLDLNVTPIGKYMTGLDVILKHAQDWEQHSSRKFSLGDDLRAIQRLSSSWRKLEMESWSGLVKSREQKKFQEGSAHWARLHNILHQLQNEKMDSVGEEVPITAVPSWIWTDCAVNYPKLPNSNQQTRDVVQAVESFFQTACIGGVDGRLRILRGFTCQLDAELASNGCTATALLLVRSMKAVVAYYRQFSTLISEVRVNSKKPFVEQLEKETKLAKWDDQTYYAALESSQRNHRKVINILREYEQSLDKAVVVLYEEELCRGVRPNLSSKAEVISTTPSSRAMFPFLERSCPLAKTGRATSFKTLSFQFLDCSSSLSLSSVQFPRLQTTNLRKYTGKILKLTGLATTEYSQIGESSSVVFRENIMERLCHLRSPKASRQMKERALTDLFRKLKSEGFFSSKLNLPNEIHQAHDLFELPLPNFQYMDPDSDAELFYQRFLAETMSFQQEVDTIGSDFMTKAQLDTMTATVKHGLFILVQQRCALHGVIRHLMTLSSIQSDFARLSKPSWMQDKVQTQMKRFREDFLYTEESLKQQILYLKTCEALVDDEANLRFLRSTRTQLDDFVLSLDSQSFKQMEPYSLVCEIDVNRAEKELDKLSLIEDVLRVARERLSLTRCLPETSFDSCISSIETSKSSGRALTKTKPDFSHLQVDHSPSLVATFLANVSGAVKAILLTVQSLTKEVQLERIENATLLQNHRAATVRLVSSNLSSLETTLLEMKIQLVKLCSVSCPTQCPHGAIVVNTAMVLGACLDLTREKLGDYLKFHTEMLRLQYVLVRVFRVLTATGFCTGSEPDDKEHDTSEMTFEDNAEGTGMGEGEGKQDVTDQIENEEQLLGLKEEEKDDDAESNNKESKKLDREEAETGMEMEENFDGELHDVPEQEGEEEGDDENKEELDREMGNEPDGQDEVLDEKLWDDSDSEDDNDAAEGLEENSKVKDGDKSEEMTTKDQTTEEEDEEQKQGEEQKQDFGPSPEVEDQPNKAGDDDEAEDKINEELYEENNNVDVQGRGTEEDEQSGDQMSLDDNMSIDDDESQASENAEAEVDDSASVNPDVAQEDMNVDPSDEEDEDGGSVDDNNNIEIEGEPSNQDDDANNEKERETSIDLPRQEESHQGLGVSDFHGNDAVDGDETGQEGCERQDNIGNEAEESTHDANEGARDESQNSRDEGGHSQEGQGGQLREMDSTQKSLTEHAPNPLTNPSAAADFWRQKVNILAGDDDLEGPEETARESDNHQGDHELANDSELHALAECEDFGNMTDKDHEQFQEPREENSSEEAASAALPDDNRAKRNTPAQRNTTTPQEIDASKHQEAADEQKDEASCAEMDDIGEEAVAEDTSDEEEAKNIVVSNFDSIMTTVGPISSNNIVSGDEVEAINAEEETRAREQWLVIQSETYTLSRRLCESLRLVIEPLVASKLRGDYRTGKRINMKRVISYIASGYRKDKIWLRRTKPAKRNYRVLLAVDDSQSMLKSGAGEVALQAMGLIITAMSQLEIGEVGIASFGNEMKLVHPFQSVFAPSSGASVVREFRFNQQRTRTALCIESAIMAMEEDTGDFASMQLFFMISDGRIERDSRADIRRLVREMVERNILLVLIIVEGDEKNSISNMKEVSFEKGKPVVKRFMDDYPFPYFIIVNDMNSLPEVLADSLRQWFEILARLQGAQN